MDFDFPEQTGPTGYQVGDYLCLQQIGKGAFGQVYQAISVTDKNFIVALKVLNKKKIQQIRCSRAKAIRQKLLKTEVQIMKKLKCQHITKCYNTYENSNYIIIALEFCNGGDLFREIKRRGKIPQEEAIRILKQIMVGFAEMHKHNIIHRDLKSENILKHNEKYKIADFGMAKIISSLNDISEGTTLGNLMTMAPEVMERHKYGIKADIWSLGVVFYEMIFGKAPYVGLTTGSMAYSIRNQQLKLNECSKQVESLLRRMLVPNPDQRISWSELYREPILYKYSKSTILEQFQEDVALENSRHFHENYQKIEKENCMIQELDAHDKRRESQFDELKVKKMQQSDIRRASGEIQYILNESEFFKNYTDRLNFQRQKSMLILEEIIQILDDQKLGIKKDRQLCQLLFLMSSRCLFTVSPVNDALKREKNIFGWQHYKEFLKSTWCFSFIKDFKDHYQIVYNRHTKIEKQVFAQDVKISSRMSDFFWKITDNKEYKAHDRFLCGIEGLDFSIAQQIKYTISKYWPMLQQKLAKCEPKKERHFLLLQRLKFYISKYYHIATADFTKDRTALIKINQEWKEK